MTRKKGASSIIEPGTISEAVILMAGSGSRLRAGKKKWLKPLIPLLGRPLISYTFDALVKAQIGIAYSIVGFESHSLIAQMQPWIPPQLSIRFIKNRHWQKQNGLSVLSAAGAVSSPFLLLMSDHLFDQSIIDLLLRGSVLDRLNVAVDRKLDAIYDLGDAMKVKTHHDCVVAIGKDLREYDAIDAGAFVCSANLFNFLEEAKRDGDCSLADGVRAMGQAGQARVLDIGAAWWQDVDTPETLAYAEKKLSSWYPHLDFGTAQSAPRRRNTLQN